MIHVKGSGGGGSSELKVASGSKANNGSTGYTTLTLTNLTFRPTAIVVTQKMSSDVAVVRTDVSMAIGDGVTTKYHYNNHYSTLKSFVPNDNGCTVQFYNRAYDGHNYSYTYEVFGY